MSNINPKLLYVQYLVRQQTLGGLLKTTSYPVILFAMAIHEQHFIRFQTEVLVSFLDMDYGSICGIMMITNLLEVPALNCTVLFTNIVYNYNSLEQ